MTSEPGSAETSPRSRADAGHEVGQIAYTVLSARAIWWSAGLIVLTGVGVAVWLLTAYGEGGDQQRNQLEAIKTAGTIIVATGGAAALLLAARRQRTAEIAVKQKDQDLQHKERDQADVARAFALQERVASESRTHQQQVAQDAREDAVERRITELYTKAADQLGSNKAPVRLAGLYALERLAQGNPDQRQTIVNVLCAYLRMPYQLLDHATVDANDPAEANREALEEREVRMTAQRVLTDHLNRGEAKSPPTTFWKDISLNLNRAILIDFNLADCTVETATFDSAIFAGRSSFFKAIFRNNGDFTKAIFKGDVTFFGAAFYNSAAFSDTRFDGAEVTFNYVAFEGLTDFRSTMFNGDTNFERARFGEDMDYDMRHELDQYMPLTSFDEARFKTNAPAEVQRFLAITNTHKKTARGADQGLGRRADRI